MAPRSPGPRPDALISKEKSNCNARIAFSEHFETDGPSFHAECCKRGLEGIVSKRRDAHYISSRNDSWQKITCRKRDTFTVVAFAPSTIGRGVGALYLGRREGKELIYVGKAGTGYTAESVRTLRQRLDPMIVDKSPLTKPVKKPKAIWVKPKMLVDVEYRAVTADGFLRHASFKGVREHLM